MSRETRESLLKRYEALLSGARSRFSDRDFSGAKRKYAQAYLLRSRIPGLISSDLSHMPHPVASIQKFRHDVDQLDYLVRTGRLGSEFRNEVEGGAEFLRDLERRGSRDRFFVTPKVLSRFQMLLGKPFPVRAPAATRRTALNLGDATLEIEERYRRDGFVIVDGFLRAEAMERLRRFCLESWIWNDIQPGRAMGQVFEVSYRGLLSQIVKEMRRSLPAIFDPVPFSHLWASHYENRCDGMCLHTDQGDVTANFWLTPDEANLEPTSGGLLLYRMRSKSPSHRYPILEKKPPEAIYRRLKKEKPLRIPYKFNRMVIFDARRFHETGKIRFADGYENRRLVISWIFGKTPNTMEAFAR